MISFASISILLRSPCGIQFELDIQYNDYWNKNLCENYQSERSFLEETITLFQIKEKL